MLRPVSPRLHRFAATAVMGAALALPSAAQAHRAFFGFGFGFPGFYAPPPAFFYPPPVYVPPPVVYAPPPATYLLPPAQAPASPASSAGRCYAGDYVCPTDRPGPVGAPCSCPTNTGRARGRIG